MPKVYFKGNMPAIEVSEGEAGMIQDALENSKGNAIISLGNITVKVSEIKAVTTDSVYKDTSLQDADAKWLKERQDFCDLSPQEKNQKSQGFVKLMSRLLQYEFNVDLTSFFEANPKRLYPDFSFFKDLLPERHGKDRPIDNFSNRMLTHVGTMIQLDKQRANEIKM